MMGGLGLMGGQKTRTHTYTHTAMCPHNAMYVMGSGSERAKDKGGQRGEN